MEELINPYGTEWHDKLENKLCVTCKAKGHHEFVLSEHGYSDPLVFCDIQCLIKFVFDKDWQERARF